MAGNHVSGADGVAQEVLEDFRELSQQRSLFDSHWDEVADLVLPNYRNTFYPGSYNTPGERKTEKQFDSSPMIALDRFGSIMDSLLTPRSKTWHTVKPSDPELLKDREVQLYFGRLNQLLFKYRYAPGANFASQNALVYKGLGAFGTSAMYVDSLDSEPGLRYRAVHIGELYLRENHQGLVDTVLRRFVLTARKAAQVPAWKDKLPQKLTDCLANPKKRDTEFTFYHRVRPRGEYDENAIDRRSLKFESVYVSEEGPTVLEEGGYRDFPYAVTRYDQAPNETYGRSPAMAALPAIKTLNVQKRVVLTQGHRAVNPVLLTSDDGTIDSISLQPGSIVKGAVNTEGRALVQPLPTGDVLLGKDLMDDEKLIINDAFLVALFQILVETPDRMTATEVVERAREKGMLLAPTVGRQQSEYLGPMISREIDVLASQGLLPPFPQALIEARGEYTIQYESPLARMARADEAAGFMRVMESLVPVINVTQDASVLDAFDFDTITRELSDIQAVPPHWMKSLKDVQGIRQQRAEQAQLQQQIAAAPGQAQLLKAAADAKAKGLKEEDLQ